jgi:hypothetical protein
MKPIRERLTAHNGRLLKAIQEGRLEHSLIARFYITKRGEWIAERDVVNIVFPSIWNRIADSIMKMGGSITTVSTEFRKISPLFEQIRKLLEGEGKVMTTAQIHAKLRQQARNELLERQKRIMETGKEAEDGHDADGA